MGKHQPLDLYHAVMGEMWDEENRRAGGAKVQAAARLPRSYRSAGRPSARNVIKASQGSRAAVFKRIRGGGCKTRQSLTNQLDYVNDKAMFTYSTMTNSLGDQDTLTTEQKDQIIEQWSGTWRGTSKLGFTSHMLLSFPTDVSAEQVQGIALDWCEHFFDSGHYGDEWDYVLAVHTDRDHPHAHVLLNNRGKHMGEWFACWAEGVMSPQLMREKQAEIAESYGVALDATTRLERGIFAKPAGLAEIYAAKAEGRRPHEIALTEQETAMAQAAVNAFAKDYRDVADVLEKGDKAHLASSVRRMANTLADGNAWTQQQGTLDLAEIRTVGEAMEYAETRIGEIQARAEVLEQPERTTFELRAAPVIAGLSRMVPDPELRVSYNQELAETYPPGSGADDLSDQLATSESNAGLSEILSDGQGLGLDTEAMLARLEAGGTRNFGLAQSWVDGDLAAILAKDGLELSDADPDQVETAMQALDGFQMRLAAELGSGMQSAFAVLDPTEMDRDAGQGAHEEEVGLSDDPGFSVSVGEGIARSDIRQLAQALREGELTEEEQDGTQRALVAALHNALGEDGIAELDRGHWQVLDDILPGKVDQISVTQEYLEIVAEERGAPDLADIAADLHQVKATERARELAIELKRDHDLDDDLGL